MTDENNFKTALGMCQMMLRNKLVENSTFLTSIDIRHAVEELMSAADLLGCGGGSVDH